jgi:hypothetical protein
VYEVGYEVSLIDRRCWSPFHLVALALFAFARSILKGKKLKKRLLEDYFVDFLIVSSTLITPPTLPIQPRDPAHLKFLPK